MGGKIRGGLRRHGKKTAENPGKIAESSGRKTAKSPGGRPARKVLIMAGTALLVFAAVILTTLLYDGRDEASESESTQYESSAGKENSGERIEARNEISQVIISMGENPDTLFISWKGGKNSGNLFRICADKSLLSGEEPVKARRHKALEGKYYRYSVEVKDVEPGREYFYEIGDRAAFVYSGSFKAPDDSGETKFLYLGDVQFEKSAEEYSDWEKMVERIYEENPDIDFAIIGGDMVNVPSDEEQWNSFLDSCTLFSRLPLMTVSGNHEGVASNKTYKRLFSIPRNGPEEVYGGAGALPETTSGNLDSQKQTSGNQDSREKASQEQVPDTQDSVEAELDGEFYYFDYGKCRFIMMDSSFLTDERRQRLGQGMWSIMEKSVEIWLETVTSGNERPWTVAVVHHPVYGFHDKNTVSPNIRRLWEPIMEKGGVDMVFCGHQHMYMRTRDINGIVHVMGNSGRRTSEYYNGSNSPIYSRAVYGDGPNYQIVSMTSSRLEMVSYNEKGLVIDETAINKGLWFHILELFSGNQIVV